MNHSTELKPQSFQWKIWGFLVNAGEQVLVNQNLQESSPILSGPISLLDVYNIQYLMRAELENETKSTQLWIIPFLGFHLSLSWCQVSTVSTWKERGSQSEHLSIDIVICKYIYIAYMYVYIHLPKMTIQRFPLTTASTTFRQQAAWSPKRLLAQSVPGANVSWKPDVKIPWIWVSSWSKSKIPQFHWKKHKE